MWLDRASLKGGWMATRWFGDGNHYPCMDRRRVKIRFEIYYRPMLFTQRDESHTSQQNHQYKSLQIKTSRTLLIYSTKISNSAFTERLFEIRGKYELINIFHWEKSWKQSTNRRHQLSNISLQVVHANASYNGKLLQWVGLGLLSYNPGFRNSF